MTGVCCRKILTYRSAYYNTACEPEVAKRTAISSFLVPLTSRILTMLYHLFSFSIFHHYNFTSLFIYCRLKSVARRSATSSCYAHFFKRSAHKRHFTSATTIPPVTTVAISNSLISSLHGFTYELRATPPAHHMSAAPKRCCCGCGFLPEEGRNAHECETTGLRLYAVINCWCVEECNDKVAEEKCQPGRGRGDAVLPVA